MRKLQLILLLLLCCSTGRLTAQESRLELKSVPLETLVHFLRQEFQADIYSVKDPAEQSSFTVSAPRGQFFDAALDALRDKGYVISRYGDQYFLLHG